jgi:hypothetical protein
MRYSIRKLDSDSKRYVRPKEFAAELSSVGSNGIGAALSLTLCDPRTKAGEGLRMNIDFEPADMQQPLMAAFMGRLYAMMPQEMRDEMMRVAERQPRRVCPVCNDGACETKSKRCGR